MNVRLSILAIMLALHPTTGQVQAGSLEEITERGELIMLSFPQQFSLFVRANLDMGAMRKSGGAEYFEGIDVDLMQAFAEELGVRLTIRSVDEPSYQGLIPDLLAGKGDLIACSFSITEDRRRRVAFSAPYFSVDLNVIARKDLPVGTINDLAGFRAATISGSSNHRRLLDLGFDGPNLFEASFVAEVLEAIEEGVADFTIFDSSVPWYWVVPDSNLGVALQVPSTDTYGVAFPLGSDLLPIFDRFLAKATENDVLSAILTRQLGTETGLER